MNTLIKMQTDILSILNDFTPISLEEMSRVRLMDRIDTKYVISLSKLPLLLQKMVPYFRVQVNNQTPVAVYATQYFDTLDLDMFLLHHNGKLNRQKIRIRTYQDSELSFLEIKSKNNKGRTRKYRTSVDCSQTDAIEKLRDHQSLLDTHSPYEVDSLFPSLANTFKRITFVNNKLSERVTIDLHLHFVNNRTGLEYSLGNLVVLELKQDASQHSDFKDLLIDLRIKQSSFSKYCMGTVLTNSIIKSNNFKKKINRINNYYYDTVGF